jgi:hypothetical protein
MSSGVTVMDSDFGVSIIVDMGPQGPSGAGEIDGGLANSNYNQTRVFNGGGAFNG